MDAGAGNELVPGAWTHLVFVHDGAKDYIYINGNLAAEKDVVGLLKNTTFPLGIGYNVVDGGSYFDGALDDILIYNSALTAPEVAALYALQSADPGETDSTAPEAPLGLKGEVNFTDVTLSWQPSVDDASGIAGYNVYQDGDIIQTVEETEVVITGLEPLTDYEFGVSAVDSAGNESATSFLIVTTGMDATPDTIKPSTPTNLAVSAGATSAVFSWDASTDEGGVAYYIVYLDGDLVDTLAADQTSIFIGGLEPSTLYTFEVEAVDLSGNISERADITVSTTEPIDTGEDGLVAHYKFEGDANDATPYNNHGAIGGNPVFEPVTGRPNAEGMAIVFDGDGDSVLAPNAVQLISDYATVGFWIRVDDQNLADAESYVIDFGHWDERWKISLPQHLKIVWTTNGNNAQFDHFISDMDSGDGNELVIGFWWYVTMVHDGTDDIIYVDGVEANRKPVNTLLNSTARSLGMGNNPIEGGQYFIGALDEVKLYNKALTGEEVERLYTTGSTVGVKELQTDLHKYVEIVYPNPTKDELVIKHGFGVRQDLLVRMFDQSGREVGSKHIDAQDMDNGLISLNVAGMQSGMYNLNFVLGGKNLGSVPFVKQ
jgi:chitodextrinase